MLILYATHQFHQSLLESHLIESSFESLCTTPSHRRKISPVELIDRDVIPTQMTEDSSVTHHVQVVPDFTFLDCLGESSTFPHLSVVYYFSVMSTHSSSSSSWDCIPHIDDTIDLSNPQLTGQLSDICRKCLVEYYDRVRRFYVPKSTMVDLRNGQTVTEVIRVTGGITNSLFKVKFVNKTDEVSPSTSAPADSTAGSSKGDYDGEVSTPREGLPICLVRVFGEAGSSIIDRDNENKVFNDLSSIGFGPALLGIFRNGRIEEFFSHLRPLEPLEMVTEKWIPSIAKHLRYMHSLSPKSAAEIADGGKSIDLWKRISSYVEKGRELVRASPEDEETDFTEMLDSIEKQAHWLEGTIRTREKGIGSPLDKVVFCHNDLLSGNILVSKEHPSSQLKFIDYEYCAFNPAAADIANHFAAVVESMLIVNDDYNIDKYFPSRELQLLFLRNYLTVDEYARCDDNSMLETIRLYAMAAELRWCAWSVIQHFEQDRKQQQQTAADDDDEDIDDDPLFDYENYGRARLGGYFDLKNQPTIR